MNNSLQRTTVLKSNSFAKRVTKTFKFLLLLALVVGSGKSWGQVNYVSWDFTTALPSGSYDATQANMDAVRTTQLTSTTFTGITCVTVTAANNSTTLHRSTGWPANISTIDATAASYTTFSITLGGGQTFPNSTLSLDLKVGNSSTTTAPNRLLPLYGYGTSPTFASIGSIVTINGTQTQLATITIPAPGNTTTTKLTIRIAGFNASPNTGTTGNMRLSTVALTGPAPTPSCTAPTFNAFTTTNISCVPNNPTGSATVNPTGGSTPYTGYSWSNGQSLATATGLAAGTYTVTVTATGGCTSSANVTITGSTAAPTITGTLSTFVGFTTQLAGSGTPDGTTPWSASNGNATVSNTGLVTGVTIGTCNITYKNSLGCTTTSTVTITAAPDYSITTTGNAIVITDLSGNGEGLSVSQNATNIRFIVTPTTRTYSINGGSITAFTTPADAALAGVTDITINQGAGNDILNVAAFSANLPNLTINGGTGDDGVFFNGNLTFAANANLDVDMQNDDPTPGVDNVTTAINTQLLLSGTGSATIKVSQNVAFGNTTILSTVDGNLTIEANQQATPTTGNFRGVSIAASGQVKATGTGVVTVKGKGGNFDNSGSGSQYGIMMSVGSKIIGGTTGTTVVEGRGGSSFGGTNFGVYLLNTGTQITSNGSAVSVIGVGGGIGVNGSNYGVILENNTITAGGSGNVTVNGTGGGGSGGTGNNFGVNLSGIGGIITSSGGNVSVTGTGGGTSSSVSNYGVALSSSTTITAGGSGTVTVNGTGGATTGGSDVGVYTSGTITSNAGNVSVTGLGGGTGATNYGIYLLSGSIITAGGSGSVTALGTGSTIATGSSNSGVVLTASTQITSSGGNVSVTGNGGGTGASSTNIGINNSGAIYAGANGTVTVNGTGGTGTGGGNSGVSLSGISAYITSGGAAVSVTGLGGNTGTSNYGVSVSNNATITSGGIGTLTVLGTGGASTGDSNTGVNISGGNSIITSGGGNVNVTGFGGGSGSSASNYGVALQSSGTSITPAGNGTVTVNGTGGATTGGSDIGVYISGTITSNNGNVSVTGQGGGSGAGTNNNGVFVFLGTITSGGSGTVTVNGTGGGTATSSINQGLYIFSGLITSGGSGTVTATGTGGLGTAGNNYGLGASASGGAIVITSGGGNVNVYGYGGEGTAGAGVTMNGCKITAGGSGTVLVNGTGGTTSGANGVYGVWVSNSSTITSSGGNVTVTGVAGSTGSPVNSSGVNLQSSDITAGGTGTVTVQGTASAGSNNSGVQLNSTASITSAGGNVNVTGTTGSGTLNYDISFAGGTINSVGGDVTLTGTSQGVRPNTAGTDVTLTGIKTVTFGSSSKLAGIITGTTADTQYDQLNVVGQVNLNSATLSLTSSAFTPVLGNTFTIVDNDGSDAITGTFAGLPEGSNILNFLGSSLAATITYVGGTGNDVVLTVVSICADPDVPTLAATSNPTCSGNPTTLSVQTGNLNSATAWQWYTGSCGGTLVNTGTSFNVSPTTTTTYYVRGEGGCVTPGSCGTITITVNQYPTAGITGTTTGCSSVTLTATGGTSYLWSGGSSTTSATNSFTSSGTYTVTVTANGCSTSTSAVVTVNAIPTAGITGTATGCSSVTLTATGGTSYLWSGGSSTTSATNSFTTSGTYTVTVTNNGCSSSTSAVVTVNTG